MTQIFVAFPPASTANATFSNVRFSDDCICLDLPAQYTIDWAEKEILNGHHSATLTRQLRRTEHHHLWDYYISSGDIDPDTGLFRPDIQLSIIQ